MKVGVMPRADTRKLRSTGEPDALKGACPVREGAAGNLHKPVVLVVRRHEDQQGAGRLPYCSESCQSGSEGEP